MNKVLVVVDAQEDFTRGALRNEEAIKALPVIHDIVDFASYHFEHRVIYTQDTHYKLTYLESLEGRNLPIKHCIYESKGWQLCPEVLPKQHRSYICQLKRTFGHSEWDKMNDLHEADEIWLCGFCTDICVSANLQILKATYPETPIIVIEDACAGVTPELHEAALKVMKSCQARIVKWEDLKKENEHEV